MITPLLNRDSRGLLSAFWRRTVMTFMGAMLLSVAAYAQPLSGSYTVCSSGTCDYSTIGDAVSALTTNGVSGAVTINIAAGTYNENVDVTAIAGVSATNTVTFKGAGMNSTTISQGVDGQTFRIYYSDYIRVEDLKIENTYTSTRYGLYVYYSNHTRVNNVLVDISGSGTIYGMYVYYSDSGTYTNNKVVIPHYGIGTTSTNYALRHYYSSYNTWENNDFEGGYYGLYIYGSSNYNYGYNLFKENTIKGTYYYPFYAYYNYSNVYDGNVLDTQSSNIQYHYGIYSNYEGNVTYKNNVIKNSYYGIRVYYPNRYGSSSDVNLVYNNTIIGHDVNGYYGLYLFNSSASDKNLMVYHNTIHLTGSSGYGLYLYNYSNYGTNIEIKNNIFYRTAGQAMYIYDGSRVSMDGNVWNIASNNMGYYNTTAAGTYADYVLAAAADGNAANSTDMPVTFVSTMSPYDLHLDQNSPAPIGLNVGIDKDMDGDSRCLIFPTPGADENKYGKDPFKAKFFVPSIVYDQSPVVFFNFAKPEEPKLHRWYIDGVFVTDSVHLATALTGTSHVVSLVTIGCAGTDSTWQTVTITTPPAVPVTDFIANQNIFPQGGEVMLSDLSTYGPSSWQWEITPEQTYVGGVLVDRYKYLYGTSATSQNPIVQFTASGNYKVCLTATNARGMGNKECKVDYIEVTPQLNMGDVEEISARQGILFDSGGPNGEALNGGETKLLINACAEDVYLVFHEFDMMCGYNYLRIYDGEIEDDQYALHPCTSNASNYGSTGLTGGTGYTSCNGNNVCKPELSSSTGPDTFRAKSGKMLIVQDINYPYGPYGYTPGFKAEWWSTPKTFSPPVASIEAETTVCQNGLLTLKNTSTGEDNKYNWDLDGDLQTFEATDEDEAQWLFTIPGKQTVTLIARNCGGADTFTHTIDVFVPNKPNILFTASNTRPTPADVVFINNQITECVDEYEWSFTRSSGKPGTVVYMNGTSKFAENPQVMFSDTGCWDATLVVTNAGGTSTLKKSCFINVKESYCVPSVATMSKDVGISEVAIMSLFDSSDLMRNQSPQGVKDYSNYVNNPNLATGLEIGVTYLIEVKRTTNANAVTRNIWIDWNLDGDFEDPQEQVAGETNAKTQSWTANVTVPIIAKSGASVMRVAINTGQFSNEVCGQNRFGEYEDYRVELSDDRTPPVITLFGADGTTPVESGDTIVIEQGRMFTEWGFQAVDNLDGDITSNISSDTTALPNGPTGTLNTFVVRDYKITYYIQDATGNKSDASRIISITPDTTAPFLSVGGTDTIRHNVDDASNFQLPQVISVNDIVDGIQVNMKTEVYNNGVIIQAVDPAVVDTYTVVFTATDAAGNMTEVTRVVIIEDVTAPQMALIGANPAEHPVHTPYSDEYVTFSDNYWSGQRLEDGLSVVDNVNENVVGTYTYEYSLEDPSGNGPTRVVRTVNVVDREDPVASIEAEDTIKVEVKTKFDFPEVSYNDNYWSDEGLMTEWTGTLMPTIDGEGMLTKIGEYTLQFVVTDSSNNITTIERVVVVEDLTAPEIELVGEDAITVCRWEDYEDLGYTVEDNYWAEADITVDMTGSFIDKNGTDIPGLYTLRYVAKDSSGNVGYSQHRSILVLSENEYPCYMNGIEDATSLEKLINVYPNPSTGNFTVKVGLESQQQLRISVMNLLGEELSVVEDGQVLSNVYNVDLSNRASGVYLLKVQGADYSFTKRLVIQK